MQTRNARMGFVLFAVYLVLYGGFVLLNTFSPGIMEATPFAGINVAIWYGFGLIIAALLLALVYGLLCNAEGDERTAPEAPVEETSATGTSSSAEDDQ